MQQSRETAARSRVTGAPAAAVGPRSRNGRRTERVAGRREASGRRRRTFLDDNYFDWPASRPAAGRKITSACRYLANYAGVVPAIGCRINGAD